MTIDAGASEPHSGAVPPPGAKAKPPTQAGPAAGGAAGSSSTSASRDSSRQAAATRAKRCAPSASTSAA